ncbi:extracellular calcium-sensing receptor-like isoform X2 [Brachyhypopomus gauderio]|uniref:extracellular calcium-sensing receptor-like isoform X2 n=1 Tax=Brachyhypopomus gauderio TaxID=698409 RepID=UPI004042F343
MAMTAWLWALEFLTVMVWVNYVGPSCTLQSRSNSGTLYKEGDVIIGGLFPVHFNAPEPDHSFIHRAERGHCQGADLRCYRWVLTMIFTVEEINRDPALLPNLTLGYLAADSCLSEGSTLSVALAMVTGQEEAVSGEQCISAPSVPVIIGDARSAASIVLADTLGVFDIPLVSYLASCACLSDRSRFPTFLRTVPSDAFQTKAIARLLSLMGWSWIGVISGDDAYGRSGVQLLLKELEHLSMCIEYLEILPKSAPQSRLKHIVERIQSSKAKVVVTFAIGPDVEVLLGEVAKQNLSDRQWIATSVWSTSSHHVAVSAGCLTGTLGFALRRVDIQGLDSYLTQLYPEKHLQDSLVQNVLEEVFGCRPGEQTQTGASVPQCTGLEKGEGQGEVYSDINYNVYKAVYAIAYAVQDMLACKPGQGPFEDGECPEIKSIRPKQVPVSVCSESCPPGTRKAVQKGKPICCYDCVPCATGEISNVTDSTDCSKCPEWFWSNPERTECVPMVVEFLSFQDNMGIVLSVLSVSGATLSGTILAAFLHHRDTPLVRANNSELSFLLLLSLKLCFLCALAFIGRPAPWSCMLRHTLFGISFVVCLACVLSKTVVVLVAFRATLPGSNVMQYFGPVQQRVGILLCTLVQVVVCVLWLVLAPPVPTESAGGELGARVVLLCAVGSVAGFSLVLGYIGLLAAVCFLLAFFARKLPDNFNEAKFITFSMLIFWAVWIAFVPAYVSSPGKYTVAVEVFAILASSYGLLLCIFAPKCYIILLRPEKNTKKNMMAK